MSIYRELCLDPGAQSTVPKAQWEKQTQPLESVRHRHHQWRSTLEITLPKVCKLRRLGFAGWRVVYQEDLAQSVADIP